MTLEKSQVRLAWARPCKSVARAAVFPLVLAFALARYAIRRAKASGIPAVLQ
ncbi:hypothetical protein ACWDSD_18160 [Streptomyces spiralis]